MVRLSTSLNTRTMLNSPNQEFLVLQHLLNPFSFLVLVPGCLAEVLFQAELGCRVSKAIYGPKHPNPYLKPTPTTEADMLTILILRVA